jgi:SAM-dependent methyltransferase
MKVVEHVHGSYVLRRRVRVLADHFAALLPRDASVLDVGCGDGSIAKLICDRRPDVKIRGIDLLVRPNTAIVVEPYDGHHMPAEDGAYDVVMFSDVLHHTDDPRGLLQEARRVARRNIILKDHTLNGWLAGPTLRFMDGVGNGRFGVALPYNYWTGEKWRAVFLELHLEIEVWESELSLYPAWADWLWGRSLHLMARLGTRSGS